MIKQPLTTDEIKQLGKLGNMNLKELINTKSQSFKKLQPDLTAMNDAEVIALINNEPRIMRRPLLVRGKKLLFGFDSEAYQQFLG